MSDILCNINDVNTWEKKKNSHENNDYFGLSIKSIYLYRFEREYTLQYENIKFFIN